jgi:hypothetical protein
MAWMIEKQRTASGAKALQRADREDRIWQYNSFHKNQNRHFYAANLDSIEYGYDKDGNKVYLGVIELTRANSDRPVSNAYLDAVMQRFSVRDSQAAFAIDMAQRLGVDAYLCIYRVGADNSEEILDFCLFRLSGKPFDHEGSYKGWSRLTPRQYATFLRRLRSDRGIPVS